MKMVEIIAKKRDGIELSEQEISFFIMGYVNGQIPDYQASALLMAMYLKGLSKNETIALTKAMLYSGETVDLKDISGFKVDKHSTGGVGDKVTLVLAPILASFGVKLAKMSGRGLGHTGGTLDKLESIPGFDVNLSIADFTKQVNQIGLAVIGQTKNLVPADKLLYALRDVTATVSSIPLIASSIMSKKLASGADVIILDVKVGEGAFMKNIDDALALASTMREIGESFGKKTMVLLTDMSEPLGYAVGNSLEVMEAVMSLKGKGPVDLMEVCFQMASMVLMKVGLFTNEEKALAAVKGSIDSGCAFNKLVEMVEAQKGDSSYLSDLSKLRKAKFVKEIYAVEDGYISEIDALEIGNASMMLGAGRRVKSDVINPCVGIVLNKKVGSFVHKNDCLAYVHLDEINDEALEMVLQAFKIGKNYTSKKIILERIGG